MTSRRGFLIGLGAALAAPAVVKADSLMKIAVLRGGAYAAPVEFGSMLLCNGAALNRVEYAELFRVIGTV